MKIELHKQFKVPVDGLIPLAEEITLKKEKKEAGDQPFTRTSAQDKTATSLLPTETPPGSADVCGQDEHANDVDDSTTDAVTTNDRKAHKKLVKAQQRDKRKLKKQLKQAFNGQMQAQAALSTTEVGGIRQGVSVKKIY